MPTVTIDNTKAAQNTSNPTTSHGNHMNQLVDKLAGQKLNLSGISGNVNARDAEVTPKTKTLEEIVETPTSGAPEPIQEDPALNDSELTLEADSPEPKPTPQPVEKPARDSSKLAKSLEIQRRADEAAKRAKAEKQRLDEQRKAADLRAKEAEKLAADVKAREAQINKLEREYQEKLQLAQTNPLEFARVHGVDGASIAQFVKEGADPTKRQMQLLEAKMANAVKELKAEYQEQLDQVKGSIVASRQAEAKRNFFDFVDNSVKAAPETFQAMDVVYSPDELWSKAHELAERSDKLELGWDHDRLLEEIEAEAKKDPRWSKLQSRFQSKTAKPNPQVSAKSQPNTQSNERQEREAAPPKPKPARERDPLSGQFAQQRPTSPMERHQRHLDQILKSGIRFR